MIFYLITNESFPGWVKIGFTTKSKMTERLRVYQTGTPFRDYVVEHEVSFSGVGCVKVAEREVHQRLADMGYSQKGEWFEGSTKIAKNIIDSVYNEMESNMLNVI